MASTDADNSELSGHTTIPGISLQQTPTAELCQPSTSGTTAPEDVRDGQRCRHEENLRPQKVLAFGSPNGNGDRGESGRQVTFGVAVQTDFSPYDQAQDSNGGDSQQCQSQQPQAHVTSPETQLEADRSGHESDFVAGRIRRGIPHWLDCTTLCYLSTALLMITVGLIVTAVALEEENQDGLDSNQTILIDPEERGPGAAQTYIVGPIFLCSGILICIKAGSHIYKKSVVRRDAHGNFLSPDSRASLNLPISTPPSYSTALQARVPSTVIEQEDTVQKVQNRSESNGNDNESLSLVTLNFEPAPPSYDEAMEYIRRNTLSVTDGAHTAQGRSTRAQDSQFAHLSGGVRAEHSASAPTLHQVGQPT